MVLTLHCLVQFAWPSWPSSRRGCCTNHHVERTLFLDVVVRDREATSQNFAISQHLHLVCLYPVNLCQKLLHFLDRVHGLHFQGDSLTIQFLDENIHCLSQNGYGAKMGQCVSKSAQARMLN